jgi:hypothetical protein
MRTDRDLSANQRFDHGQCGLEVQLFVLHLAKLPDDVPFRVPARVPNSPVPAELSATRRNREHALEPIGRVPLGLQSRVHQFDSGRRLFGWREDRVYFLAFSLAGPGSSPYREIGQPEQPTRA